MASPDSAPPPPARLQTALRAVFAVALAAELAAGRGTAVTAPLAVAVCLLPWRRLTGAQPADRGSPAWAWTVLAQGMAAASLATWALRLLDPPPAVLVGLPVLVTFPALLRGGWIAIVRPAARAAAALDAVIVALSVALAVWPWVVDVLAAPDVAAAVTSAVAFVVVAAVGALAAVSALRDAATRVALARLAVALLAFGVALLVPPDTALGAYRSGQAATAVGYALMALAAVHGQLRGPGDVLPRAWTGPPGGSAVVPLVVLLAFVANAVTTDVLGLTPSVVEAGLQVAVLTAVVTRVVVNSRSWRRTEAQLEVLAHTDELTGLRNRAWLHGTLERLLDPDVDSSGVGLALVDVDRFKMINDSLGHEAGDAVLRTVAERLRVVVADGDVVRFGGDEFLVLVPAGGDGPALAQRIVTELAAPMTVAGRELATTVSVGLATAGPDAEPATLIRDADIALYRAKDLGRNRVVVFDEALRTVSMRRLQLEQGLREALDDGSLTLAYQPVVAAATDELVGVEALLRWTHPTLGPISPGEFIGIAEDLGTIVELGNWVVERACRDLALLDGLIGPGALPHVSVNVSAVQLLIPDLVGRITATLATYGLGPDRLVVEVTESALLDPAGDAARTLAELHDEGIRLAVDDVGTGYSALAYLEALPVDVLKIDRSFTRQLTTPDGLRRSLVPTLVRIAERLGLLVVAEGVEEPAERDLLLAIGCDVHQGYLYDRPLDLDALTARLTTTVDA